MQDLEYSHLDGENTFPHHSETHCWWCRAVEEAAWRTTVCGVWCEAVECVWCEAVGGGWPVEGVCCEAAGCSWSP